MKKITVISHNNKNYALKIGSKLKHCYSDPLDALLDVFTDDIQMPNGLTAGNYKKNMKDEYNSLPNKSVLSSKKYLNESSEKDFGINWDDLIVFIKKEINNSCIPLLLKKNKRSEEEQYKILKAASNGHIGAMFCIGTALKDGQNDDCLLWLSMAHNRGHVGSAYEIAIHLANKGNFLDSLRCLIISADSGFDIAYLNIFSIDILNNMLKIDNSELLHTMLDELIDVNELSSAHYFKGILSLFLADKFEGIAILEKFMKYPKNRPGQKYPDDIYNNQVEKVSDYIKNILTDIETGMPPLSAVSLRAKEAGFISFTHHSEFVKRVDEVLKYTQ